jgi:hypothetical protein
VSVVAGDGQVLVSWKPPDDDGGAPVEGYQVSISGADVVCQTGADSTSCVVSGLVNGSQYVVTVVASNPVGPGVPSAEIVVSPAPLVSDLRSGDVVATEAVNWLVWSGVAVVTNGTYAPDVLANRTQMMANLWRMVGEPSTALTGSCGYTDFSAIALHARTAACWAKEQGIIIGDRFAPTGNATRGQVLRWLWQASGAKSAPTQCHFDDFASIVPPQRQAACWAKEHGMVIGDRYAPNWALNRRSMGIFLYRLAMTEQGWATGPPAALSF